MIWGISFQNLQMMLADAVAVLLHTDDASPAPQPSGDRPRSRTTSPMGFGEFLKAMHDIQGQRQ